MSVRDRSLQIILSIVVAVGVGLALVWESLTRKDIRIPKITLLLVAILLGCHFLSTPTVANIYCFEPSNIVRHGVSSDNIKAMLGSTFLHGSGVSLAHNLIFLGLKGSDLEGAGHRSGPFAMAVISLIVLCPLIDVLLIYSVPSSDGGCTNGFASVLMGLKVFMLAKGFPWWSVCLEVVLSIMFSGTLFRSHIAGLLAGTLLCCFFSSLTETS